MCNGGLLIWRTLVGESENMLSDIQMAGDWHSINNIYIIQLRLRLWLAALTTVTDIHAPDNNPVNQSISSIGSTYNTNTASPLQGTFIWQSK